MYRRVNSGGFIGATTLGIVIIMAVFTWVIWGLARQVFVLTDVMIELNSSFKSMVVDMDSMAGYMGSIDENMVAMRVSMEHMDGSMVNMSSDIGTMTGNVEDMTQQMAQMNGAMNAMTGNVGRMAIDLNRASTAFSNPMSYMFNGGPFPF